MASRGKNILIGCGIGCASLAFVFIIALISFFAWVGRPGELLEAERLLGEDTGGFVELVLRTEDPGMQRLLDAWVRHSEQLTEEARGELHPIFAALVSQKQRRDAKKLRELFPIVVAWTVRDGDAPDDDLHLFTISLKQMGNRLRLMDWFLGLTFRWTPDVGAFRHRGETIYELPKGRGSPGGAIFLRGNDVFYTTDLETARRAVDRLVVPVDSTARPPSELARVFAEVPQDYALRGALTNRGGQVLRLVQSWDDDDLSGVWGVDRWDGIEALTVWGGFAGDSGFEGTVNLLSRESWTVDQAEALQRALQAQAKRTGISIDVRVSPVDERLRIEYRLNDLTALLDRLQN